ncbi:MAG: glycosyltransferase, partial [Deinococcota bacterium]|nr:glycosyltransferase [Deinococcota bacterium]
MKFLFNVHGYKPAYNVGGPIHSVSALAEGLVARGHSVFVATSNRNLTEVLDVDPSRVYDRDGVEVRYFAAYPTLLQRTGIPYFAKSAAFRFDSSFTRWLLQRGADFDVFHTQIAFLPSSRLFSKAAKSLGKVYFYHQRGAFNPVALQYRALKKRLYLQAVEKPVMRRADLLIALTEHEAGFYKLLGLNGRTEVLPNGVAGDFFPNGPLRPGAPVRELLQAAAEQDVFLFLSRLHPSKGPELFVEAFLRYAQDHPRAFGIVAGPDEFGLAERLKSKVAAAGLAQRLRFVGAVAGDDKMALFARADAFVLPTASEGFSIVLLEALMCGCAVVTTPGAHFGGLQP